MRWCRSCISRTSCRVRSTQGSSLKASVLDVPCQLHVMLIHTVGQVLLIQFRCHLDLRARRPDRICALSCRRVRQMAMAFFCGEEGSGMHNRGCKGGERRGQAADVLAACDDESVEAFELLHCGELVLVGIVHAPLLIGGVPQKPFEVGPVGAKAVVQLWRWLAAHDYRDLASFVL